MAGQVDSVDSTEVQQERVVCARFGKIVAGKATGDIKGEDILCSACYKKTWDPPWKKEDILRDCEYRDQRPFLRRVK